MQVVDALITVAEGIRLDRGAREVHTALRSSGPIDYGFRRQADFFVRPSGRTEDADVEQINGLCAADVCSGLGGAAPCPRGRHLPPLYVLRRVRLQSPTSGDQGSAADQVLPPHLGAAIKLPGIFQGRLMRRIDWRSWYDAVREESTYGGSAVSRTPRRQSISWAPDLIDPRNRPLFSGRSLHPSLPPSRLQRAFRIARRIGGAAVWCCDSCRDIFTGSGGCRTAGVPVLSITSVFSKAPSPRTACTVRPS